MIIKQESINSKYIKLFSLNNKEIVIPIFQRFYEWTAKNVEQLLKDIENMINNSLDDDLYLLNFIYYEKDNKIYLADGQQRLVTINIFIKLIREEFLNIDSHLKLFDIKYETNVNNKTYEKFFYDDKVNAPFSNVYKKISKFLEDNEEKIEQIIEIISNKITINFIECENINDAFEIFCEINTGGKKLLKSDLIISALNQYSQNNGDDFKFNENYGNKSYVDIEQLLISYYLFKSKKPLTVFNLSQIYEFLNDEIKDNPKSFNEFKDFYLKAENYQNNNFLKQFCKLIKRQTLASILDLFSLNEIDINKKNEYKNQIFFPLCFLSIICSFNGTNPSKFRNLLNALAKLINEKQSAKFIKKEMINFAKVHNLIINYEEFLYYTSGKILANQNLKKSILILDLISCSQSVNINSLDNISLEHIFPQNSEKWIDQCGHIGTEEELNEYKENIGNFLLLNTKWNSELQNSTFDVKYEKYQEVKQKDSWLNTEINFETIKPEVWKKDIFEAIFKRHKVICEKIYKKFDFVKWFVNKE